LAKNKGLTEKIPDHGTTPQPGRIWFLNLSLANISNKSIQIKESGIFFI
jgi:hypothetical protein